MSTGPDIETFLIDAAVEAALEEHGLNEARLIETLDNRLVWFPSGDEVRGDYLVVGVDRRGVHITMPIVPTHEPGLWRPLAAWPSTDEEQARYACLLEE